VSVVNPMAIHAYAKSQLARNKTDALDADLIARCCAGKHPQAGRQIHQKCGNDRRL